MNLALPFFFVVRFVYFICHIRTKSIRFVFPMALLLHLPKNQDHALNEPTKKNEDEMVAETVLESTCLSVVTRGQWKGHPVVFKRNLISSFSSYLSHACILNEIEILNYLAKNVVKEEHNHYFVPVWETSEQSKAGKTEVTIIMPRASIDLFEFMTKKVFDDNETFAITQALMKRILQMVGALHTYNVAHNDIKLENFVIFDQANPVESLRFIDFGMASIFDPSETFHLFAKSQHNSCKYLDRIQIGTSFYRHPALLSRQKINMQTTDMFACGMLCFTLFTNSAPIAQNSNYTIKQAYESQCRFMMPDWTRHFNFDKQILFHPQFAVWAKFVSRLCRSQCFSIDLFDDAFFDKVN